MAERRYYWLKLPEDFFRDKRIKKLRRIAGGDTYTCIYLKMLLASMQTDGKLYFDGLESNPAEEIALDLDEDEENVSLTLNWLISAGLAEFNGSDVLLTEAAVMVGSEQASAARVRKLREKSKLLQCNTQPLLSNNGVTECNEPVTQSKSKREIRERDRVCSDEKHICLGTQILYTQDYNTLCEEIGKSYVDQTISRIVDTPYTGCLTVERIRQWATEAKKKSRKKTGFSNYTESGRDYEAAVRQIYGG